MTYAELDVRSNFSFLEGASHPAELVFQAKALGLDAIGVSPNHACQAVAVGHADGLEPQRLGPEHQLLRPRSPLQETVVGPHIQLGVGAKGGQDSPVHANTPCIHHEGARPSSSRP